MMEMAAKDIEKLGGTVELVDIGKQKVTCHSGFVFNICILTNKQDLNMHCMQMCA